MASTVKVYVRWRIRDARAGDALSVEIPDPPVVVT